MRFPLAAVLYVNSGGTPGVVDGHGMKAVQDLLSHMTGRRVTLDKVPRAVDVCQKYLRDQYSWLEGLQPSAAQAASAIKLQAWARSCVQEHGGLLDVAAMPGDVFHDQALVGA